MGGGFFKKNFSPNEIFNFIKNKVGFIYCTSFRKQTFIAIY